VLVLVVTLVVDDDEMGRDRIREKSELTFHRDDEAAFVTVLGKEWPDVPNALA